MADGIPFYDNIDLSANELQNFSFEKVAADFSGSDLYEGRAWLNTTSNTLKLYRNSEVKTIAFLSDALDGGKYVGTHDATTGIPTSGSGEAGAIEAGDIWVINVAGTIAGIEGSDELSVGDLLIATADAAASAANFVGVQRNLDDDVLTAFDIQTVNLVAATPLTVTAANFTGNVISVEVYNSAGRRINVRQVLGGSSNQIILRSNQSLSNLSVRMVGAIN